MIYVGGSTEAKQVKISAFMLRIVTPFMLRNRLVYRYTVPLKHNNNRSSAITVNHWGYPIEYLRKSNILCQLKKITYIVKLYSLCRLLRIYLYGV